MYIQGVANFLDDLMGGLQLAALSMCIGGLIWALWVLRAAGAAVPAAVLRRCVALMRTGALALAGFQALKLVTKGFVLDASLGDMPWHAYLLTDQFIAGGMRLLLALSLWAAFGRLARPAAGALAWWLCGAVAAAILCSDAWLVHAVGRFEDRGLLMGVTVLHQLAAFSWVGGVIQLLGLWRLSRHDEGARACWPQAVSRFSPLGFAAVTVLVLTGIVLGREYVGSWAGMLGTGYGSLMSAKIFLLLVALGFAALNFRAGRRWAAGDIRHSGINDRIPYYIEAESFILISLLFVAASLSSMPPAVDIPTLTATVPEVLHMFAPQIPSLASPTHAALLAGEPGRLAVIGRVPSAAATNWSDYNHNVAGLFLLVMGLFALISYVRGADWARYWPAGFMLLGLFLFFRSDAESWPLGPIGFWESTLGNGEVLQHRLATLLAFSLGAFETRARTPLWQARQLRYMFPALCAAGGVLLVTHSHLPFEIKTDYLIQSTHLSMGLLATLMAAGRWLELRLAANAPRAARACGLTSILAMLAISYILLAYREPLY